jgi:hypothetical protein
MTVSIKFCLNLLSHSFWNFFLSDAQLRGVLISEGDSTFATRYNVANFIRLHHLEQWQQLLALLNSCGSEILRQLVEHPSQMK